MLHYVGKKILSTMLLVSFTVGSASATVNNGLTDTQLHAVLGIVSNFILSDVDSDGDGVLDSQDAFPHDPNETTDTDGDGIGNNADSDDDGDGALDVDEVAAGTDPLNPDDLTFAGKVYKVVTSPYTGYKWLDRNLGASQVCAEYNDTSCYGDYYQWGRDADGHEDKNSARTTTLATSNPVGHSKFIQGHPDWISGFEHNYPEQRAARWSRRDGTTVCPVGFRVPTLTELSAELIDSGSAEIHNRDDAYNSFLKLPSSGGRILINGQIPDIGENGYLWSSSIFNSYSALLYFRSADRDIPNVDRSNAVAVRCMKPIVTTDTPPVVTLVTEANISMIQFGAYPIIRAVGYDDVDGVIVPNMVVRDSQGQVLGSFINTSVAGIYTLTYTATDSLGQVSNTVTVTVTVHPAMKKTGQTVSYDENGTEVTDGSLKDDGYYQKGHDPLYVRDDGDEIVSDNITGLDWQDDAAAKSVKKQWLTDENYDICKGQNGQTQDTSKCTDTSGDTATTYCANLTLGGYTDWRLPTIDELMNIADRSKQNPAIDTSYFQSVVSDGYWSSSTVVGYEYGAWSVFFYSGYDFWSLKSNSYYVRCVRDGQ